MRVGAMHAQEAGACMHRYICVAFVLVFIPLLRIVGTYSLIFEKPGRQISFLHSIFAFSAVAWSIRILHAARVRVW